MSADKRNIYSKYLAKQRVAAFFVRKLCSLCSIKREGGLLAENELYSGASGFCCGNGECDPCKEIRTGSLSDCSCECPLSSSVPLVMLRAHGCHFVALFDRITDLL